MYFFLIKLGVFLEFDLIIQNLLSYFGAGRTDGAEGDLRTLFNIYNQFLIIACGGALWAHHTRPRPSCLRSRRPCCRLDPPADRRGRFCSGTAWSEGRDASLQAETQRLVNTSTVRQRSPGWWTREEKGAYRIFMVCLQRKALWATVSALPHMSASSSELSPQSSLPSQTHI